MKESTFNNPSRTLIIIKPDSIRRGLIGKIISRFEDKGFSIISIKQEVPDIEKIKEHYKEHEGRYFYNRMIDFMLSAEYLITMVLERDDAVFVGRRLVGSMDNGEYPAGSIRGDYSQNTTYNLVHASDSEEAFKRELNIWFNNK
jgi:nucleoside-diphosphate kinase